MSDIRLDTPRVADLLANLCDRGDDRFGEMTKLAQRLEREVVELREALERSRAAEEDLWDRVQFLANLLPKPHAQGDSQ